MHNLTKEELGKRIGVAIATSPYNQREAGELSGISDAALSNYVRGKRTPSVLVMQQIARALGTTVSDILGESEGSGNHAVPVVDRSLGAGPGGSAEGIRVIDTVSLPTYWLRNRLGLEPRRAFMAPVQGDSLRGLLNDGDLAIGGYCETIERPGVYAVHHEGELIVKHARLERGTRGVIATLKSTNDAYPDIEVYATDSFHVVGRIRGKFAPLS